MLKLSFGRHGIVAVTLSAQLLSIAPPAQASAPVDATSTQQAALVQRLTPPQNLGTVVDAYAAGAHGPVVIQIQDIHADYETQVNISKLLAFYAERMGSTLNKVAVEGAQGAIPVTAWGQIPDRALKMQTCDRLLRLAELTGAEAYAIVNNKPNLLWGVEDERYHRANVDLFRKTYERKQDIALALQHLQDQIAPFKEKEFTRKLRSLEKKAEKFNAGKIALSEFASTLADRATLNGINVAASFPEVSKWTGYGARERFANSDKLLTELSLLLRETELRLAKTDLQRNIIRVFSDLDWLHRLTTEQLTTEEVRALAPHLSEIGGRIQFLLDQEKITYDPHQLSETLNASMDFYGIALLRDQFLSNGTLALLPTTTNAQAATDSAVVLVAGGFHTPGVTQRFREKKISYVVITPRRSNTVPDRTLYTEKLLGMPPTLMEMSKVNMMLAPLPERPFADSLFTEVTHRTVPTSSLANRRTFNRDSYNTEKHLLCIQGPLADEIRKQYATTHQQDIEAGLKYPRLLTAEQWQTVLIAIIQGVNDDLKAKASPLPPLVADPRDTQGFEQSKSIVLAFLESHERAHAVVHADVDRFLGALSRYVYPGQVLDQTPLMRSLRARSRWPETGLTQTHDLAEELLAQWHTPYSAYFHNPLNIFDELTTEGLPKTDAIKIAEVLDWMFGKKAKVVIPGSFQLPVKTHVTVHFEPKFKVTPTSDDDHWRLRYPQEVALGEFEMTLPEFFSQPDLEGLGSKLLGDIFVLLNGVLVEHPQTATIRPGDRVEILSGDRFDLTKHDLDRGVHPKEQQLKNYETSAQWDSVFYQTRSAANLRYRQLTGRGSIPSVVLTLLLDGVQSEERDALSVERTLVSLDKHLTGVSAKLLIVEACRVFDGLSLPDPSRKALNTKTVPLFKDRVPPVLSKWPRTPNTHAWRWASRIGKISELDLAAKVQLMLNWAPRETRELTIFITVLSGLLALLHTPFLPMLVGIPLMIAALWQGFAHMLGTFGPDDLLGKGSVSKGSALFGSSLEKAVVALLWMSSLSLLIVGGLHVLVLPSAWALLGTLPLTVAGLAIALQIPEKVHRMLNLIWFERAAAENPILAGALAKLNSVLPNDFRMPVNSTEGADALASNQLPPDTLEAVRRVLSAA